MAVVFYLEARYTQAMLDEYKRIAAKLVSLKSISGDPQNKEDCTKTAEYLKELLDERGFNTQIFEGDANPIVFGSYVVDEKLETCLIYGHYDVQRAKKEDGWDSDPFEMVEKDGRLFGRGIMDDKCQFLIHILAISKLIKEKKLGYNIKFLFEGNEETGSPTIEKFITEHTDLLSCEFAFLSDGELAAGMPTIELSNRGIINFTLSIKTATGELHSGIYGGAAPNALHELSNIIASLIDKNNKVTVEGFYDEVDDIASLSTIPFDIDTYKHNSGTKTLLTEPEYDYFTQVGLRPAISVTGMYGGHTQEGYKNTIPHTATAKINVRLVKSQNPKEIANKIEAHLKKIMPAHVEYSISLGELVKPTKTDINNKFVKKTEEVLKKVFQSKIQYKYVGGTEPVCLFFQEILKKPVLLVPFANEDGHMHGANENFIIANIEKGLTFSKSFFEK